MQCNAIRRQGGGKGFGIGPGGGQVRHDDAVAGGGLDEFRFAGEEVDSLDFIDDEATAPPVIFLGAASHAGLSHKLQCHSYVGEEIETATEECQAEAELVAGFECTGMLNRWAHGVWAWNIATTRGFIAQGSHEAADRAGVDEGAVCAGRGLFVDAEAAPESLKEGTAQSGPGVFVQFQLFCDSCTDVKVMSN